MVVPALLALEAFRRKPVVFSTVLAAASMSAPFELAPSFVIARFAPVRFAPAPFAHVRLNAVATATQAVAE